VARSGGDASLDRRKRNYKLVLDPTLKPGSQKVYRFDGSLPGVMVTNCVGYMFIYYSTVVIIVNVPAQCGDTEN